MKLSLAAGAAIAALIVSSPAAAVVDGLSLELGSGDDVHMGRIAVQWDWRSRWLQTTNWHLSGYWDLALGYWDQDGAVAPGEHSSLADIGLTPVLRWQRNDMTGVYVEAGIGLHLLSHSSIGGRRMSTAFQFGDHIGVGYRFGARQAYDLSYRFQHMSNASIKRPNPGINFNQIRLQYRF